MGIVVQKFGGSSVSDAHHVFNVAKKVISEYKSGNQVVVVVSAQGDTTDNLIKLSKEINVNNLENLKFKRELDMLISTGEQISASLLAMAIQNLGYSAISLTGWQAGITTTDEPTDSEIIKINTTRIKSELDKNNIVIITGFQGINSNFDITTIGRGGSDTSAVALAGELEADFCKIYTDVDGVYTADPRIVPTARKFSKISSREIYLLSVYGAQVLNSNSILLSEKYNTNLKVLSSFDNNSSGTQIIYNNNYTNNNISGIAIDKNLVKICINNTDNLLEKLKDTNLINLIKEKDLKPVNKHDLNFTYFIIEESKLNTFLDIIDKEISTENILEVSYEKNKSKISVVNLNESYNINIASLIFEVLNKSNINIELILCDNNHVSVVIKSEDLHKAANLIHKKLFEEDNLY
ncbi:MAG: aspartate kinase [Clostridia bacterium]|nr:aspartate kinase [Clostridia bacterium]MBQ3092939.1 aspartate kinase [Clostridia bacterium]